jgi:predicted MFS family arabinose efflux permease
VLVLVGTSALLASPYLPALGEVHRRAAPTAKWGPLRRPGPASASRDHGTGGAAGAATYTGVTALADGLGRPQYAGFVEAAMGLGAVCGGLIWARMRLRASWQHQMAALLTVICWAATAAWATSGTLLVVALVLSIGALATSPVYVVAFTAADDLVAETERTEASTWVSVGANTGSALGTAAAGLLVALAGTAAPLALAATLAAVGSVLVLLKGRRQTGHRCDGVTPRRR